MTQNLIQKAKLFATQAHSGQTRGNGTTPYITHPEQTAAILSQVTQDPEMIAAAWLHDTIEDTDVTYEQLVQEFGQRVADLVNELTKEKTENGAGYFPHLETRDGALLKFADRLSNLGDMVGWSDRRKEAYIKKSKFWASTPEEAEVKKKSYTVKE